MTAKPTRLDSRLLDGSDELVHLCLPDWFRNSLLSLTERMLWTRVWQDRFDNEYILSESDKTRIEYGIWRLTLDGCGVDEILEKLEELNQRLEDIENMNINVNCGCGCGCGCGDPTKNAPPNDYLTVPPTTGGIGTPVDAEGLSLKCGMANYLIYSLRLAAIQSATFEGGYQSWDDYWGDIFTFINDPNLTKFQYNPYITVVAALTGIQNTDVITIPLDQIYNQLVCAIYSASDSQEAANRVNALLVEGFSDYFVRTMMTEIASQLPYDAAFDGSLVTSLPAAFAGRDCSGCDTTGFDWPEDTNEYAWRVGSDISVTLPSQYTDTLVATGDKIEGTATITAAQANWDLELLAIPPTVAPGEEIVGFTYRISSTGTSGGVNDPSSGAVRINGDEYLTSYRKLWWLTGYQEIENLASFDFTDEDNAAQIVADRAFVFYARVGIGQTPPGYASARVTSILWCVKLAA